MTEMTNDFLRRLLIGPGVALVASSCVLSHLGPGAGARPPELVGEWVDLRHTTPADTALWILRADGYDGSGHLLAAGASTQGSPRRTERRYGTWFLDGALGEPTTRAICFAKRLGRDGRSCLSFSLDTIAGSDGPRRHLVVHGYLGEHHTGDRELVERTTHTNGS